LPRAYVYIDEVGNRYGKLKVLEYSAKPTPTSRIGAWWLCHCDCGETKVFHGNALRSGHAKSCGCGRLERVRAANRRHGLSGTPEYQLWWSSKQRANEKGLPHTIRPEDVVIPVVCPVLGIPLNPSSNIRSDNSPSLDRFIPALGYVPGNIAVISWRANRLKNNATAEEITAIAQWMNGDAHECRFTIE